MIPHPLKYLLIAHGYRNPFYIEWVSYHAIFYFSLAREILKYALSIGTYPRLFSSFVPIVRKSTETFKHDSRGSYPSYPWYNRTIAQNKMCGR
jgi:hypothetical protein